MSDNEINPKERHKGLQDLSRDHHEGLLLCFKIREGIEKNIDLQRIMDYATHVFRKALQSHMQFEEAHIYSLLPATSPIRHQALKEHAELISLFNPKNDPQTTLPLICELITRHVRFEERVVYPEIEKLVPGEQLLEIAKRHKGKHKDRWIDHFWE